MISNSRTSAPRSAVIHATDGGFTVCGRQIGEMWAGEYNEQPAEDVTCARCIKGCEALTVDLAARAKFAVGQRVGIVTGVQGPNGGTVTRYGTVIGHREFWKGTVEYIVSEDDGSELVYRAYLLSDDLSGDSVGRARSMAAHPAGKGRALSGVVNGYKIRRCNPIGRDVFGIMGWNADKGEYVVASMRADDSEWSAGFYTRNMVTADWNYRARFGS